MSFFNQLFELTEGVPMTLRVMRVNDRLTVQVVPDVSVTIKGVELTGTPQELEEGFFRSIQAPIEQVRGLVVQTQAFQASVDQQKKELAEKAAPPPAKASKAEKPVKNKLEVKQPGKKKASGPKPVEQSMFDSSPAAEVNASEEPEEEEAEPGNEGQQNETI